MDTMDVKGQASVEYLLLALVFLIIIGSVSVPLVGKAIDSSLDVSHSSDTSAGINSIANAVGVVYSNGPGAKRTINVYFSKGGTISYNSANNTIQMPVVLSNGTSKIIDASVPIAVSLNPSATVISNTNYNATVTWPVNTNTVNVALAQS
ncbi:MAG: hypothetical protein WAK14_03785 [Methanobacterium sp.]